MQLYNDFLKPLNSFPFTVLCISQQTQSYNAQKKSFKNTIIFNNVLEIYYYE